MANIAPNEIAMTNGMKGLIWRTVTQADTPTVGVLEGVDDVTFSVHGTIDTTFTLNASNHDATAVDAFGCTALSTGGALAAISLGSDNEAEVVHETARYWLPVRAGGTTTSVDLVLVGKTRTIIGE